MTENVLVFARPSSPYDELPVQRRRALLSTTADTLKRLLFDALSECDSVDDREREGESALEDVPPRLRQYDDIASLESFLSDVHAYVLRETLAQPLPPPQPLSTTKAEPSSSPPLDTRRELTGFERLPPDVILTEILPHCILDLSNPAIRSLPPYSLFGYFRLDGLRHVVFLFTSVSLSEGYLAQIGGESSGVIIAWGRIRWARFEDFVFGSLLPLPKWTALLLGQDDSAITVDSDETTGGGGMRFERLSELEVVKTFQPGKVSIRSAGREALGMWIGENWFGRLRSLRLELFGLPVKFSLKWDQFPALRELQLRKAKGSFLVLSVDGDPTPLVVDLSRLASSCPKLRRVDFSEVRFARFRHLDEETETETEIETEIETDQIESWTSLRRLALRRCQNLRDETFFSAEALPCGSKLTSLLLDRLENLRFGLAASHVLQHNVSLSTLRIVGCPQLSDAFFRAFGDGEGGLHCFPSLERLAIVGVSGNLIGNGWGRFPQLVRLDVTDCVFFQGQVFSADLFPKLRVLRLCHNQHIGCSAEWVLPSLCSLLVANCGAISDELFSLSSFPLLRELKLVHLPLVTGSGWRSLPHLALLEIRAMDVGFGDVLFRSGCLPSLEKLKMKTIPGVGGEGWAPRLSQNLRSLSLDSVSVGEGVLQNTSSLSKLRLENISGVVAGETLLHRWVAPAQLRLAELVRRLACNLFKVSVAFAGPNSEDLNDDRSLLLRGCVVAQKGEIAQQVKMDLKATGECFFENIDKLRHNAWKSVRALDSIVRCIRSSRWRFLADEIPTSTLAVRRLVTEARKKRSGSQHVVEDFLSG